MLKSSTDRRAQVRWRCIEFGGPSGRGIADGGDHDLDEGLAIWLR